MRRLYIIGNSHTACLKQAWDEISTLHPELAIKFFAHRGKRIAELEVEGEMLVPNNQDLSDAIAFTSGGDTSITPEAADVMVLYGLGLKIPAPRPFFYSKFARDQALLDLIHKTRTLSLLEKVRSISDVPILIGHDPLPAEIEDSGTDIIEYHETVAAMNRLVFKALNALLIPQPEATLANGTSTVTDFSRESTRLSVGKDNDDEAHPDKDIYHMNAAFGELVLGSLLSELS